MSVLSTVFSCILSYLSQKITLNSIFSMDLCVTLCPWEALILFLKRRSHCPMQDRLSFASDSIKNFFSKQEDNKILCIKCFKIQEFSFLSLILFFFFFFAPIPHFIFLCTWKYQFILFFLMVYYIISSHALSDMKIKRINKEGVSACVWRSRFNLFNVFNYAFGRL